MSIIKILKEGKRSLITLVHMQMESASEDHSNNPVLVLHLSWSA